MAIRLQQVEEKENLNDWLDRDKEKPQYISRQYRRLRKSLYLKLQNRVSVSDCAFKKVRAMHIKKYQFSGKKIKVEKAK